MVITEDELKSRITAALDTLPQESLRDIATYLDYLQFKHEHEAVATTPYVPVALGGLWQGATITESDIAAVRHEMWARFGEHDL